MQLWDLPTIGTENAGLAVTQQIPNALRSLRGLHSGNSAPLQTEPYMLWAQGSTGTLWMRNAADTDWIAVGPLGRIGRDTVCAQIGTVSATRAVRLLAPLSGFHVERVVLLTDTASTSSSGNEWQFALTNVTESLELFSATVGTFTALSGVGGGAELAANSPFALVPDQNASIGASDVVTFTLTKVGSATTLADVAVLLEGWPAG